MVEALQEHVVSQQPFLTRVLRPGSNAGLQVVEMSALDLRFCKARAAFWFFPDGQGVYSVYDKAILHQSRYVLWNTFSNHMPKNSKCITSHLRLTAFEVSQKLIDSTIEVLIAG